MELQHVQQLNRFGEYENLMPVFRIFHRRILPFPLYEQAMEDLKSEGSL